MAVRSALQIDEGQIGQIARCQLKAPVITSCRPASYWNKDWRPGPAPQTEEEMRAAAKKYKMLYEDYKVRAESEGLTWSDYPKLPTVTAGSRDPEDDYDFPTLKRNYGEPGGKVVVLFGIPGSRRHRWELWVVAPRQTLAFGPHLVVLVQHLLLFGGRSHVLLRLRRRTRAPVLVPVACWSACCDHWSFQLALRDLSDLTLVDLQRRSDEEPDTVRDARIQVCHVRNLLLYLYPGDACSGLDCCSLAFLTDVPR
ncbi:hypothetical protein MRX96_023993 [Rhipicephalus microplus]